jgi:hypothetical protein
LRGIADVLEIAGSVRPPSRGWKMVTNPDFSGSRKVMRYWCQEKSLG